MNLWQHVIIRLKKPRKALASGSVHCTSHTAPSSLPDTGTSEAWAALGGAPMI